MTTKRATILFTAFEPSGDDLAAAVIRAMMRDHPEFEVVAWGGHKMEAAGATLVERTGEDAVVGLPGLGKILEHIRLNGRIKRWMDARHPVLHVAVDSPASNFPICKMAKRRGIAVMHLAAPQLWAWAPWRIRKLRRCTDHVLCLLPFEEAWFRSRGVPATFIGHPLFSEMASRAASESESDSDSSSQSHRPDHTSSHKGARRPDANQPSGSASVPHAAQEPSRAGRPFRLLVAPGSRPSELRRHMPTILEVLRQQRRSGREVEARFVVQDGAAEASVHILAGRLGRLPDGARIEVGHEAVDRVAAWADAALAKSGTVTLRLAAARLPMVVFYRTLTWGYVLIGRWLLTGAHHAMPNLIAGRRIVDEFVPHVGGAGPIAEALGRLIDDAALRERERADLDLVARLFEGRDAASAAARLIEECVARGLQAGTPAPLREVNPERE